MRRFTPSRIPKRLLTIAAPLAGAALLAACAPGALQRSGAAVELLPARTTFEAEGRLSARHGADAFAANFRWHHDGASDELELSSPTGQTIAVLTGDGSTARLTAANGRTLVAAGWTKLTMEGLGLPLPVEGLAYWVQGAALSDAAYTAEAGADGRASVLRQDGWTIVYQTYAQTANGAWRPTRLVATYPEVEIRVAIDRWE